MIKKYILIALSVLLFINCSRNEGVIEQLPEDTTETIYTLPVVVHIIHSGEEIGTGYNLSKERIINQLKTLNGDFRKKVGTLGYNTHPLGTDAKIEFKLAEINPNGKPTDGITRVDFNDVIIDTNGGWLFDDLPYYGYWDRKSYINIWVYPFKPNIVLGQSSVPFVDLPGLNDADPDGTTGILITTPHFGVSEVASESNLGRTLTHEMGHFLGLEHLWGKTENANCTSYDDYCNDTPSVARRTGGCGGVPIISCIGETVLTQNYMDYTKDSCMNMFTKDQVIRMRYVLKNSIVRKLLILSSAIDRN